MDNDRARASEYHLKVTTARLDSFLVATAFLVTAYATVIVAMHHSFKLLLLADAISAVGLYLAIFFAIANFYGSLLMTLEEARESILAECEKLHMTKKCIEYVENEYIMAERKKNFPEDVFGFLRRFSSHLLKALFVKPIPRFTPDQEARIQLKQPSYVHSWLIPLLLLLFWLIVPFCVLPDSKQWTAAIPVGIPALLVIRYSALPIIKEMQRCNLPGLPQLAQRRSPLTTQTQTSTLCCGPSTSDSN